MADLAGYAQNQYGWRKCTLEFVDRCPVFNVLAKKLDTIHCLKKKCPPYIYRSNEVDVEYACRYKSSTESSTPSVEFNVRKESNSQPVHVALYAVLLCAVLTGILLHFYRRKSPPNSHAHLEIAHKTEESTQEFKVLIEEEADTNKAEEPNFSLPQAWDSTEEPNFSFPQARDYLEKYNWVVITGVQGAGKTYLAKFLVEDLEKKERKFKSVWISNLNKSHGGKEKQKSRGNVLIFDEIFYETQMELHLTKTFENLKSFLHMSKNKKIIITIPSYIWQMHNKMFSESKFDRVHIDLDEITNSEKRCILQNLMKRYKLSRQEMEKLCSSECTLLEQEEFTIGFPALISWLCKPSSEESVLMRMKNPLSKMSDRIKTMKKEEPENYLILSYIAIQEGTLDINNIDKDLLEDLTRNYAPELCNIDLQWYAKRMVGEYLLEIKDGIFTFDLKI